MTIPYTNTATISPWKERFEAGRLDPSFREDPGRMGCGPMMWISIVVDWVVQRTPRDFGFLRSPWSCGTLVIVLRERLRIWGCAETVRRWLTEAGIVGRRFRPKLGPKDQADACKMRRLK